MRNYILISSRTSKYNQGSKLKFELQFLSRKDYTAIGASKGRCPKVKLAMYSCPKLHEKLFLVEIFALFLICYHVIQTLGFVGLNDVKTGTPRHDVYKPNLRGLLLGKV